MPPRAALVFVLLVVAFPLPAALAHHTVALTHDVSQTIALTGTVTEIQWQNPHVVFHLAVPAADGALVDWEIESRHPQGMRQDGIDMDTIKVGETVTMNVMLARDGSHHAATASVVLADGRTVRICTVTENRCP
jgi:hypothetical protein